MKLAAASKNRPSRVLYGIREVQALYPLQNFPSKSAHFVVAWHRSLTNNFEVFLSGRSRFPERATWTTTKRRKRSTFRESATRLPTTGAANKSISSLELEQRCIAQDPHTKARRSRSSKLLSPTVVPSENPTRLLTSLGAN